MKKIWIAILGMFLISLVGCRKEEESKSTDHLSIVTTFYPMYNFTKEIVKDSGNVTLLIPAGTEPHDYEPTPKDILKINQADAFIYNSKALEMWVEKTKENFGKKVLVVEAAQGIPLLKNEEKQQDPHVWLSPELALQEVQTITEELVKKFPDKKEEFKKNSQVYQEKLTQLKETYQKALAPYKGRTFITQHTAFSYLADFYQLKQVGIMGLSEEEEPSPKRLMELKQIAKDNQVTTLFAEELGNNKVVETLKKETGLKMETLTTLESVSEKEMKEGKDYLSLMEENLQKLEKSFQP